MFGFYSLLLKKIIFIFEVIHKALTKPLILSTNVSELI
jgi:hypothetical protein